MDIFEKIAPKEVFIICREDDKLLVVENDKGSAIVRWVDIPE